MTKREAAEIILKDEGSRKSCICKKCPFNHVECRFYVPKDHECLRIGEQWLADNPEETEWQELDLSDHPKDLLSYENWDFMTEDDDTIGNICGPEFKLRFLLNAVENCKTIHYRKRQPEKTEPEVIIKQSGGTWVARYKERDLLCIKPELMEKSDDHFDISLAIQDLMFIYFEDIEITDEIAKLRPMVVLEEHGEKPEKLIYVRDDVDYPFVISYSSGGTNSWSKCNLATVSDLENTK